MQDTFACTPYTEDLNIEHWNIYFLKYKNMFTLAIIKDIQLNLHIIILNFYIMFILCFNEINVAVFTF